QMQEQLVQAEKMASLGTLVAGIAHELNNPIAYIYSSTEGLRANLNDLLEIINQYEKLSPHNFESQKKQIENLKKQLDFQAILDEAQELIDNIYTGANQTAEIVKGLRNFSRSNDAALELISINEVLDSTLALLHNQMKNHVELIKEYADLPQISAYPVKISQVFMNLLINAIHAIEETKKIGTIKVQTLRIGEDKVSIRITDTGVGISTEKMKHIFEPFFTDKEVGKGTGLGLSICLGIVESLGGRIVVESEVGVGSTFQVVLPIKQN
ncbi:MAG: sensor histidine kinase, partial [Raineya sp.]